MKIVLLPLLSLVIHTAKHSASHGLASSCSLLLQKNLLHTQGIPMLRSGLNVFGQNVVVRCDQFSNSFKGRKTK